MGRDILHILHGKKDYNEPEGQGVSKVFVKTADKDLRTVEKDKEKITLQRIFF